VAIAGCVKDPCSVNLSRGESFQFWVVLRRTWLRRAAASLTRRVVFGEAAGSSVAIPASRFLPSAAMCLTTSGARCVPRSSTHDSCFRLSFTRCASAAPRRGERHQRFVREREECEENKGASSQRCFESETRCFKGKSTHTHLSRWAWAWVSAKARSPTPWAPRARPPSETPSRRPHGPCATEHTTLRELRG
jgi:hypothetical protein